MPTSIDRDRKCIGHYYNDLQVSRASKNATRPRGSRWSSVAPSPHREHHSGYHKAMANIFILALLSVQLQPVQALGRRPVVLKVPRRDPPAEGAIFSKGSALGKGSGLWRVSALTPDPPGMARLSPPAATTPAATDTDITRTRTSAQADGLRATTAFSAGATSPSEAASSTSAAAAFRQASPVGATSPFRAAPPRNDETALVRLPLETVASAAGRTEPQPAIPTLSRIGAPAPPALKRAGDEDAVTALPPRDDSAPVPSSAGPAPAGIAAPFFSGGGRTPATLSSDSAAITPLEMTSTRLEAQTRAIHTLLLQHRRLDPQDDAVLSLRHRVNLVVKFVRRPAHLSQLVQELLRPAGLYGANPGEWLSPDTQHQLFNGWLTGVLFNQTFEALLADTLADAGRQLTPHAALVGQLRHWLHQLLHQHDVQGGTLNYPARKYLLEEVAGKSAPALMSWPHDRRWSALPVVDLRWAYAHAGLRLARMARADEAQRATPHVLSVDEAVDLGFALALLLEKRALPPEYLEIFQLLALLRYRYHFPDAAYPEEELRTRALERFILDVDAEMLANDPVRQFGMALDAWRSRRQLAQDAIVNRCPELARADAAAALQADTESYLNAHGPWHCSCRPPGEADLPPLPDIDGRFEEQNAELARLYATVDLLILSNTFARLDEVERDFIRLAQVTFARAERSPVAAFSAFELSGLYHSGQSVVDLVLELLPGVELLLARHQQEERIYALQLQEGRYLLSRVDRDDSRYHTLFPAPRHYRYKRYDLKIHEQQERLKQTGAPLEALAMTLATHHQTQFSTHLYQQGYDATFSEQALDFLLSLVPLYDCVRLLSRGETANALLPCAFDALALVPVVGETSAISLHFGSALGAVVTRFQPRSQ
ncbi:hypothetical protein NVIRENTERO_02486 [Sodalis praecaptivus]|nr:hypothetical protein NVIRENTERO_02486 [Sodalis praecaptivus]